MSFTNLGRRVLLFALLLVVIDATAFELRVQQVTDDVYALVGDTGPRTYDNHALNNTLGFVVTAEGVVLVDSGATPEGARLIEKAIAGITHLPVRWVINTGMQDHKWMGNSYFAVKGAEIIALRRTVDGQKELAESHVQRLNSVLKERAAAVEPVYADRIVDADRAAIELGGVQFELIWLGDSHFPGDGVVWLPERRLVFTGDLVYVDRMLGIQQVTSGKAWQGSFNALKALNPLHVVPGHGDACDLAKAQRETGDYLDWLVVEVGKAIEEWKELGETVDSLADAPRFKHLENFGSWHRININRTYLQLEAGAL
ncbi:MAG: MBL fold metallo-hydrolase [Candidatus Sedimenticola sp. (ex Thyasira tokunagai)]